MSWMSGAVFADGGLTAEEEAQRALRIEQARQSAYRDHVATLLTAPVEAALRSAYSVTEFASPVATLRGRAVVEAMAYDITFAADGRVWPAAVKIAGPLRRWTDHRGRPQEERQDRTITVRSLDELRPYLVQREVPPLDGWALAGIERPSPGPAPADLHPAPPLPAELANQGWQWSGAAFERRIQGGDERIWDSGDGWIAERWTDGSDSGIEGVGATVAEALADLNTPPDEVSSCS